MDEECPVCFEPMAEHTSTAYMGGCCRQTLHLECLQKCKFRCPFCRYSDMELVDIQTTTEHGPDESMGASLVAVSSTPTDKNQNIIACVLIMIFTLSNAAIILSAC